MGELKEESRAAFVLPDKKVTVRFIKRRKGMAAGDHISDDHVIAGGMHSGATRSFPAPMNRNGSLVNVLTKAEKEVIESITGLDLSVYGEFWKTFTVRLKKTDRILNLGNVQDYMAYKVLLHLHDHVAPSWSARKDKLTYQFVLIHEDEEMKENKKALDYKKLAFKHYGKIEDDKELLVGILKLLSRKPISETSTLLWLQEQVETRVDNDPQNFVELVQDSSLYTKILINKGVTAGVVLKRGDVYETADGLSLCEADEVATFRNAVRYLDNARNQEVRSLIEAKINNAE